MEYDEKTREDETSLDVAELAPIKPVTATTGDGEATPVADGTVSGETDPAETEADAGTEFDADAEAESGNLNVTGDPDEYNETALYIRHPETNEAYMLVGPRRFAVWESDYKDKGFLMYNSVGEVYDAVDNGPDVDEYGVPYDDDDDDAPYDDTDF